MRLSAVTLARVLALIETADLSPKGTVFLPDLVKAIAERFRFLKYPQTYEEIYGQKGAEFHEGTWNGIAIGQLTIFSNGILLDTRLSTSDSERILGETLSWASEQFRLEYKPGGMKSKRYLSNFTFYSETDLLGKQTATSNLSDRLNRAVAEITGHQLFYNAVRLDVDFCRFEKQIPIAAFTLQRRLDTPFSENKYFSEAPLPTEIHISLIEQFEKELTGK